jgi:murein DD-endopeptidase MepM/ murein hydrolase activator NlpD
MKPSLSLALLLTLWSCAPAQTPKPEASAEPTASPATPKPEEPKPTAATPSTAPEEVVKPAVPASSTATLPMVLVLPTDNDSLFKGDLPNFYMFVDRNFEGEKTTPWEAGQYGFVRNSVRVGNDVTYAHFHEGMDIAPVKRDDKGEPLDEVRSISHGEVVHCAPSANGDFGWYVVVRHDWGQGFFYSLYAHLAKILVKVGDKVEPKGVLGILGHTGRGIDKRRSHTHVELDLLLSSRFGEWHDGAFQGSLNAHGNFSGFNLAGFNLAEFFLQRQKNPNLTVVDYLKTVEVTWKVLTPRKPELELLKNYPWMGEGTDVASPSWEISFSAGGVPLKVKPSNSEVKMAQLAWVKPEKFPYVYHTRGYVSGAGDKAALTTTGARYVRLVTGDFEAPLPVIATTPTKKPEPKKTVAKKKKKAS